MRKWLTASAVLALAGCTLSVPPPPNQRAQLPTCAPGEVLALRGQAYACVSQQSLTLAQAGFATDVTTADRAGSAGEADRATTALQASGTTPGAQVQLGQQVPRQTAGPGLAVGGGVVLHQMPVPFLLGSFDSLQAPVKLLAPAGQNIAFDPTPSVTLPTRPSAPQMYPPRPQDSYQVIVRASGSVRGTGDISVAGAAPTFTTCTVTLNVGYVDPNGTSKTAEVQLPIATYGDDQTPSAAFPWTLAKLINAGPGVVSVSVNLATTAAGANPGATCETDENAGETTHVEIEAY